MSGQAQPSLQQHNRKTKGLKGKTEKEVANPNSIFDFLLEILKEILDFGALFFIRSPRMTKPILSLLSILVMVCLNEAEGADVSNGTNSSMSMNPTTVSTIVESSPLENGNSNISITSSPSQSSSQMFSADTVVSTSLGLVSSFPVVSTSFITPDSNSSIATASIPSNASVNLTLNSSSLSIDMTIMSFSSKSSTLVETSNLTSLAESSSLSVSSSHLINPSTTSEFLSTLSSMTSSVMTTPPVTTTQVHPALDVKIAETNILLVNSSKKDSLFIELSGAADENLSGLFLTIRNASMQDNKTGIVGTVKLEGKLNTHGIFVLKRQLENFNLVDLDAVVVALYSDKFHAKLLTRESLKHSLLLSTSPDKVDSEVAEVYHPERGNDILIDIAALDPQKDVSMSFCTGGTSDFVLTVASEGSPNLCDLPLQLSVHMKLTIVAKVNKCKSSQPSREFQESLAKGVVSKVNDNGQCGLTSFNIEDIDFQTHCSEKKKEIGVTLRVKSALDKQDDCIKQSYDVFIRDKGTLLLLGQNYLVANCSSQCFPNAAPSSGNGDDNNMKVTVAVVVSCICVFLVILLIVIIYMKRNRRGVLQFRMTRLDEDDDDLVGDMDDFVGHGPTFTNFR